MIEIAKLSPDSDRGRPVVYSSFVKGALGTRHGTLIGWSATELYIERVESKSKVRQNVDPHDAAWDSESEYEEDTQ